MTRNFGLAIWQIFQRPPNLNPTTHTTKISMLTVGRYFTIGRINILAIPLKNAVSKMDATIYTHASDVVIVCGKLWLQGACTPPAKNRV